MVEINGYPLLAGSPFHKLLDATTSRQMSLKVSNIYISAENTEEDIASPEAGNTDVIVLMDDGKKYIASFFSYANIKALKQQHQKSGEYLSGAYFWEKNIVLVEACTMKVVEQVVNHLIDEGEFRDAFRQL